MPCARYSLILSHLWLQVCSHSQEAGTCHSQEPNTHPLDLQHMVQVTKVTVKKELSFKWGGTNIIVLSVEFSTHNQPG